MRAICLAIILLLCGAASVRAQQADSISATPTEQPTVSTSQTDMRGVFQEYTSDLSKYATRSLLGYGALFVGIPTTIIGGLSISHDNSAPIGAVIIGGMITLSSIPLLISAYHFKHKARRLEMSLSAIEVPKYVDRTSCVPSLRFAVNF